MEKFATTMEQVVTEAGARYVQVPWSKEHCQKKTATPLKHFNEAGVDLLCARVFSAMPAEIPTGLGGEVQAGTSTSVTQIPTGLFGEVQAISTSTSVTHALAHKLHPSVLEAFTSNMD